MELERLVHTYSIVARDPVTGCQISCEIPPVVSFETPPFPVIPFVWLGEREGATPPRHSA